MGQETQTPSIAWKNVEIVTLGWTADHSVDEEEEAFATIYVRVYVDGRELEGVISANVDLSSEFNSLKLKMNLPRITARTVEWKRLDPNAET